MRTSVVIINPNLPADTVGMKPLSERDENFAAIAFTIAEVFFVGMKPLSERDENSGDSGL